MFLYRIIQMYSVAPFISQVELEPMTDALHYEAGQYIQVIHEDGEVSPLSIACAPNAANKLEFQLYHPPENLKAQDLLTMAKEQGIWLLEGPFGTCTSSRLQNKPIVFFAYGTGFAPIKAVIEELLKNGHSEAIDLYWYTPHFYLLNLIKEWVEENKQVRFFPLLTPQADVFKGNSVSSQAYVAGPSSLVRELYQNWLALGFQKEFFFSDLL